MICTNEIPSVKDSVTSGILLRAATIETSKMTTAKFSVCETVELSKYYRGREETEEKGKAKPNTTQNEEDFVLDPMVGLLPPHQDYSATIGDDVSSVGKSMVLLGPFSGRFTPQTDGVGQMKFEVPPRYGKNGQLSIQVWLTQMERYMRLMRYVSID